MKFFGYTQDLRTLELPTIVVVRLLTIVVDGLDTAGCIPGELGFHHGPFIFGDVQGSIPNTVSNLVTLTELNMSYNRGLVGVLPLEVGRMASLSVLHLYSAGIHGESDDRRLWIGWVSADKCGSLKLSPGFHVVCSMLTE